MPTSNQQMVAALPFTASAHEHVEPMATRTVALTTATQDLDPIDVPAYGFLRHVWIGVTTTVAAVGAVTNGGDFPWNLIRTITLNDVNGGNIVGPISGYSLYLANLIGGYVFINDPDDTPGFSTGLSPSFMLRVPVEISSRDGFGAWPNQNAAANLKLSIGINSTTNAYTSPPATSQATIQLNIYIECWTIPAPQDSRGRPQSQTPPLMGTGQFWSSSTRTIVAGDNNPIVTRVGSFVRNVVCIYRTAAGVRSDAVAPTPIKLNWDGIQIHNMSQQYAKDYANNKIASNNGSGSAYAWPVGVYVFPFDHGLTGRMGNETPDLWLPTTQSTRLEVAGTSVTAGTLEFLVNDVAPYEASQGERYQVPNETGTLVAPAQ